MHHGVSLITTIAAAFGLSLILGFVAVRLKLPALVGYLIAGIIIGPTTPGFVADVDLAQQLAEIGVMLLMFGVGLHFSLRRPAGSPPHRVAGGDSPDRCGNRPWRCRRVAYGVGAGARASYSAWPCRWRARWCCCGRWKVAGSSTRSTAASRSAGWWSRIWQWSSSWCCCHPCPGGSADTAGAARRPSGTCSSRWPSRSAKCRPSWR